MRRAIEYFQQRFLCDECLNPPPSLEYLAVERMRYYVLQSSMQQIITEE